jgi:hypothetical protein
VPLIPFITDFTFVSWHINDGWRGQNGGARCSRDLLHSHLSSPFSNSYLFNLIEYLTAHTERLEVAGGHCFHVQKIRKLPHAIQVPRRSGMSVVSHLRRFHIAIILPRQKGWQYPRHVNRAKQQLCSMCMDMVRASIGASAAHASVKAWPFCIAENVSRNLSA